MCIRDRVCRYNVNFPRLDLAINDRKTYLSIPELIRLKNEGLDRKSTRLNSSHSGESRMPSSA